MRRGGDLAGSIGPRLLLVCNLVFAVLAFSGVWIHERDRAREQFVRLVDRTHTSVAADVDLLLALLRGLLGLFDASVSVEPSGFEAYVRALDVRRVHPGVLGLGYAVRVGPGEVSEIEAGMHAAGLTSYHVWPLPTSPMDAAVLYLAPLDRGNVRALGYTMSRETTRRAAMDAARDTGRPTASAVVTLVQEETPGLPGFLIYLPHYERDRPLVDVEARRRALRGFVYAPIRVRELFTGKQIPDELALRVYEGADPRPTALLYASPGALALEGPTVRRDLGMLGQPWTIEYVDLTRPAIGGRSAAWIVLGAGILFSALVYRLQVLQVAARDRAERDAAALREGERRYRFLAEAMPQIVFTTDARGALSYINRRWDGALLGALLPRSIAVHPEDRAGVEQSWATSLERREPWSANFRLWASAEGRWRWSLGRALPQRGNGDSAGWVGTVTDIENQKAAEAALQREAAELEQSVRCRTAELERSVRELESFAAIASHDLQAPLRKIVATCERLSDALGPELPPAAADALARMRRSAQRLQHLIRDLLTFSRISRAEVTAVPVDLVALAGELREELLEGRDDGAVVEVQSIPLASGDPALLRQLLANLLENALKFHQAGRPPRVRVCAEPAGDEVPAEERDRWFRLLVEDQGIGFDPKYLNRIFQVFQRLHPPGRYEGTGIGLAICQRVVELHGGWITARSEPGEGAAFVCTLPRAIPDTTAETWHG